MVHSLLIFGCLYL